MGVLPRVPLTELVALLAPTLGEDKARELVGPAGRAFGETVELSRAVALLDEMGRTAGLVGVAARFARARLVRRDSAPDEKERASAPEPPPSWSTVRAVPPRGSSANGAPYGPRLIGRAEIVALLAPSLGEEKAGEIVGSAAASIDLTGELFEKTKALRLLDVLAAVPGIVGVTARFAKARMLLQ
jgi:hypothetical protein